MVTDLISETVVDRNLFRVRVPLPIRNDANPTQPKHRFLLLVGGEDAGTTWSNDAACISGLLETIGTLFQLAPQRAVINEVVDPKGVSTNKLEVYHQFKHDETHTSEIYYKIPGRAGAPTLLPFQTATFELRDSQLGFARVHIQLSYTNFDGPRPNLHCDYNRMRPISVGASLAIGTNVLYDSFDEAMEAGENLETLPFFDDELDESYNDIRGFVGWLGSMIELLSPEGACSELNPNE